VRIEVILTAGGRHSNAVSDHSLVTRAASDVAPGGGLWIHTHGGLAPGRLATTLTVVATERFCSVSPLATCERSSNGGG
jgi:hypothetical protein